MRVSPLLLVSTCALLLGLSRPALSDEAIEAARARYQQGERLFESGRFIEAAAEFEAAYKLTPRPDLLYDAGHAYDRAGDAPRAVSMYEAYLRTGDNLPGTEEVQRRIEELRRQVAFVMVRANKEGATITVDGKERGTTPLLHPLALASGLHRIDVRLGELTWHTESEFAAGLSHTVTAELLPPPVVVEEPRPRHFAAVLGLGGVIDIKSSNFPPSQASLLFGADYRVFDNKAVAVDVSLRMPLEVGQGWTHFALMPGVRLGLVLSRRVRLSLVPALDLGLAVLRYDRNDAPAVSATTPFCTPSDLATCTRVGLRIHPSLSLVYRFLPNWELRAQIFGLNADITSRPLVDPRVTFGLSAAWWFY